MVNKPLEYYIERYLDGSITSSEREVLQTLMEQPDNQQLFSRWVDDQLLAAHNETEQQPFTAVTKRVASGVETAIGRSQEPPVTIYRRFLPSIWARVAAACIILIAAAGIYFLNREGRPEPASVAAHSIDIPPGKQGAILMLADGSQVMLDTLKNGIVALQGGVEAKLINGQLHYEGVGKQVLYNTMTTPNGRQFQVTLPDGTRVWMNSASSIKYPTVFAGKERKVDITGEVYFEVAKNASMPFMVNVNNKADIQVLGTHFNVNAYDDEQNITTTLVEGSVKVAVVGNSRYTFIEPGQQALIAQQALQPVILQNANINRVLAWKNGLFNFDGATLEELMRQFGRWYDIKVVYKNENPNRIIFKGEMYRNVNFSDVLEFLKRMGVEFEMEGKTLIVH